MDVGGGGVRLGFQREEKLDSCGAMVVDEDEGVVLNVMVVVNEVLEVASAKVS